MSIPLEAGRKLVSCLSLICTIVLVSSCSRNEPLPAATPIVAKPATVVDTSYLIPNPIGAPVTGHPWVTHVTTVDLDQDGLMDIIACEGQEGKVLWLRQVSPDAPTPQPPHWRRATRKRPAGTSRNCAAFR